MTSGVKSPGAVEQDDAFYDIWYRSRFQPLTVPEEDDFVFGSLLGLIAKHTIGGTRLLDYGCGDGVVALFAASRGAETLGVDFSREAIARASAYVEKHAISNARFEQADFKTAGVIGPRFDVVWSSEVIEHVDDDIGLIKWLSEAVRPDGLCILTTRLASDPGHRLRKWLHGIDKVDLVDGHVRRYEPAKLARIVEDAGLRVVEVKTDEGLVRTFLYKYRLGGRVFRVLRRFPAGLWLMNAADLVSAKVFGPAQLIVIARKAGSRA